MPSATPTTDVFCQCGEVQAGIGTTTIGDKVVLGCEMGLPWPLISTISTIAPKMTTTTSAPPYHTGDCNVHIYEASENYNQPLYVQLNITDGADDLLASQKFKIKWGQSVSVPAADTKLPYDIVVDFLSKTSKSKFVKRIGLPPPVSVNWEAWIISLVAGSTSWKDTNTDTSVLPYCKVGGWDNNNFLEVIGLEAGHIPNRQMDCHWAC
ncbi:hypothetical protein Egran_05873 [Elaphomyces granulatus]|uniref:Uncharacterized protein n=1 Tax=Elaphomyces granulatus TaxID=519963 RepID=A0A232LQF1_9EURO|nr:hypothetical protein Egran_05873 [Elaphomyces granulatus]